MYVLEVMSGPLDGTQWRFEREITIGRDEAAVGACIAIDRYLSRSHARLSVEQEHLVLLDLSSRNGTTVDGRPVERADLYAGKAFTCGRTLMRVLKDTTNADGERVYAAPMSHISSVAELRSRLLTKPVGLVPTMGALHEGHLRLVKQAQAECASVVVSIFVNPLQFGPNEDFERYPRNLEADMRRLQQLGVNMVFTPDVAEFYPEGFATAVEVGSIASVYEGAVRPSHFSGVATVVTKLLHAVAPTRLYLGQKDAQQVAVLRQIVRDLDFATEIVVVPTDRESDGLARSSRNVYLKPEERRMAPVLYRALVATAAAFREGAQRRNAVQCGTTIIQQELAKANVDGELQYLEIVDADRFVPALDEHEARIRAIAIGALRLGKTRLLDNVTVTDG